MSLAAEKTAPASAVNVLDIANIEVIYNHVILVLKGVSLSVPQDAIVALLGANGAGKSTTLKAISNLLLSERGQVTKGRILCRGERVDGLTPNDLVRRGVIQVMEGRHCFGHLTVEENLLTGAFIQGGKRRQIADDLEKVYHYFPRLKLRRSSQAGYTSGGEQQMTAIGRALMSRPTTILLDEPSMGLAPQLVEEIFEIVKNPEEREKALMQALPQQIAHAKANAPFFAQWLKDVNPASVTSRAALARLPVLRKSMLGEVQKKNPPMGGLIAVPLSKARHIFMSPGPIFEVDTDEPD